MDYTKQDMTGAARVGYEWNPDFATPQTRSRGGQNIPFWARYDQESEIPRDTDEILSHFLDEIFDDAGPVLYQAVPIREFLSSADMSILAAGNDVCLQKEMALLDERNDDNLRNNASGTCRRRIHDGALSANGLYKALRKKRYNVAPYPLSNSQGSAHEPDADRRLIYVTDIDRWCMLAIISTAPSLQADFLRDFIYRYLELKSHFGVQVPTSGFQKFALEFHLPFYACKRDSSIVKDQRLKMHKPLRRAGNLRFLKLAPFITKDSSLDDCIYEAQVSVLVTGVDHWSWTALVFVDTYYKDGGHQQSVEHYVEQVNFDIRLDPLTDGQYEAEPPLWKPREYFLRIMESRVKQIKREWHNTVFRVLQSSDPQMDDDLLSSPESRQNQVNVLDRNTQVFFDKTTQLTQRISHLISLTIDSWSRFRETELAYFSNLENSSSKTRSPTRLISEINKDMEELQALRKHLDDRRDGLRDIWQKLENGLQVENNALQQRNTVLITALTISTSFLGLVSTTAAIFSVQNTVNAGSVIGTVTALLVTMLLIFSYVLEWKWYLKAREFGAWIKLRWNPN